MLQIAVVDLGAASRQELCNRYQGYVRQQFEQFPLLPTYSIQPFAPNELSFHGTPDVCIVGPELLRADVLEVSRLRKLYPHTTICAAVDDDLSSLSSIEQLARLGADDVLLKHMAAEDFVRRLILFSKKRPVEASGSLIVVDGAKGGVGVTTVTAALGEALAAQGLSVALIDGDFESQDLSRFLQSRPFINENLRLLLDEQRPVTKEFVDHSTVRMWDELPTLSVVPPPPEADDLWAPSARQARILTHFLEILQSSNRYILVDIGALRGLFREVLYRAADTVMCVVNNDPASLFASLDRVERIRRGAGAEARLSMVENGSFGPGISNDLLRSEFTRAAHIDASRWMPCTIPFCAKGAAWPASGGTLLSVASAKTAKSVQRIAEVLVGGPERNEASGEVLPARAQFSIRGIISRVTGRTTSTTILPSVASVPCLGTSRESQTALPGVAAVAPSVQPEQAAREVAREAKGTKSTEGTVQRDVTAVGPGRLDPPKLSLIGSASAATVHGASSSEASAPEEEEILVSRVRIAS
jgi:MinD-like ATPase involved in chromosome partitioning or flagellar assembly